MKTKIFNVVSWLVFYGLLIIYYSLYSYDEVPASGVAIATIVTVCVIGTLLFINKVLQPRLLNAKRFSVFVLSSCAAIALCSFMVYELVWVWYQAIGSLNADLIIVYHKFSYQFFCNFVVVFTGCIGSIVFNTMYSYVSKQVEYERLEKEKISTELNFLKAQINPHFIFNSLNAIYAYVDKDNQNARDAILKFGEVLRYQLYECNTERIDVSKEVSYLTRYIDLQSIRKSQNLNLELDMKDVKGCSIAPLLLSPFVENAFKYVSNHEDQENKLKVSLKKENDELVFNCYNTKSNSKRQSVVKGGGIGIENVKRRLQLLYPNLSKLEINNDEHSYEVNLKLSVV